MVRNRAGRGTRGVSSVTTRHSISGSPGGADVLTADAEAQVLPAVLSVEAYLCGTVWSERCEANVEEGAQREIGQVAPLSVLEVPSRLDLHGHPCLRRHAVVHVELRPELRRDPRGVLGVRGRRPQHETNEQQVRRPVSGGHALERLFELEVQSGRVPSHAQVHPQVHALRTVEHDAESAADRPFQMA